MKQISLAFLFSIAMFIECCDAQVFQWAKQFGGALGESRASAIDDDGNLYSAGYFSGNVDFDPGPNVFQLTSSPNAHDAFITKLDSDGNLLWVKTFGGTSNDFAFAVTLDDNANIYLTGKFGATVDFDPGNGVFNLTAGAEDVYVCKLDNDGNFIWAKQFQGISSNYGYAITVDASGNVYTAGYLQYSADFDPGPNQFFLSASGIGGDIFVSKLDASGNFVWAKRMGGANESVPSIDMAYSVAVDNSGNVYTTGIFENTADFDPGVQTFSLTANGYDAFVSKLNANGDFVWVKQFGGAQNDFGRGIALAANGKVYVTGDFKETVDFDPGSLIKNLTSAGGHDIFTIQLNAEGNLDWARKQGGPDNDHAVAIAVDNDNNVYTTGFFYGTSDFDPGDLSYTLSAVGSADLFISKLNHIGDLVWAIPAGGTHDEFGYGIDVNSTGEIGIAGPFSGSADFDPSGETSLLTATGSIDMFALKLSQCSLPPNPQTITTCDSYTWIDGKTYNASNYSSKITLHSKAGCDSIVVLNLTIRKKTTATHNITACDSYRWVDGNTYSDSNNTSTFTLTNKAGCDSLVTLNLTIRKSSSSVYSTTACHYYKWIDGKTYNSSTNSPTFLLTNKAGCDSLVTLHLTINAVNTELLVQEETLVAVVDNAEYRWLSCNDNKYIDNANDQSFTVPRTGSYAVEITQNGCSSRSTCTQVLITAIESSSDQFSLSPNPTTGHISLFTNVTPTDIEITVLNILGQPVFSGTAKEKNTDFKIEGAPGVYFVLIKSKSGRLVMTRIIKN